MNLTTKQKARITREAKAAADYMKNGIHHFRFKPDAIKALNINAARLLKWVRSADEVVEEMGYTPKEAKMYFNRNAHILPDTVKLLVG